MLELAILGLLKEQELHGYELKKRLSETLGFASGVSFGSLYPALARLERAGAVKAVEAFAGGGTGAGGGPVPASGSLSGELAAYRARKAATRGSRGKKVYGITERGEALFEELLATENQSSFHLRLAFARYLPPDARLGMLERRRAQLVDRLAVLRTRLKAVRASYALSLIEHDQEAAEHDLSWIERLIASERAAVTSPTRAATATRTAGARPTASRARRRASARPDQTRGVAPPSIAGLRPASSQSSLSSQEETQP